MLGATGHDVVGANNAGFFGLTHPRADDALDLLFDSERGLFVLTPVVAVAVAGLVPCGVEACAGRPSSSARWRSH